MSTLFSLSPRLTSLVTDLLNPNSRYTIMNTQLNPLANPFQFETSDVRTATDENNEVWFCAKDVCAVLDITWSSVTLENVPENCKLMLKLSTSYGEKDTNFISRTGVFRLIFRSNKPNAIQFADWVCDVVLKSIFQYGFYGTIDLKTRMAIDKQINELMARIVVCKNVFELNMLVPQLRDYCNIVGRKMPPLEQVKADIEQCDLFLEGVK